MAKQPFDLSNPTMEWPLFRLPVLVVGVAILCVAGFVALVFPKLEFEGLSLFNALLVLGIVAGLINSAKRAVIDRGSPGSTFYWVAVLSALLAIAAAELIDLGLDGVEALLRVAGRDNVPEIILVAVGVFTVLSTPFLDVGRTLRLGLLSLSAFCFVSGLPEAFSDGPLFQLGLPEPVFDLLIETMALGLFGLFLLATVVRSSSDYTTWVGTSVLDQSSPEDRGSLVGSSSRQMFFSGGIELSPRHPPVALAFRPGFQDVSFYVVLLGMLFWAARPVKQGTSKGYLTQAIEMVRLWYRHRIDPLSYYALDLYRPERAGWVPHLLTRFETKNGLMTAINRSRPNPRPGHEMNDKHLFAKLCLEAGIPHPQTLVTVDKQGTTAHAPIEALHQDLFCKPTKSMGAKDTVTFRWLGAGRYADVDGKDHDVFGVFASLAMKRKPMLVQPWLQNHQDLAGFAKDSLIAIRVVTVLNEDDLPEATLAMVRLLAMLEPDWQHLPDEEYAAPIHLETGELGLFTGDNFKTALVRMTHHPVTGVDVKGCVLNNWPEVRNLAIQAHKAFPHRVVVGWDIALTPNGAMVLEGNTNLDVMFLQRVHDRPAGDTRFGELLDFHVRALYAARMGQK